MKSYEQKRRERDHKFVSRSFTAVVGLAAVTAATALGNGIFTKPADRQLGVGLVCKKGDKPNISETSPSQPLTPSHLTQNFSMQVDCIDSHGQEYAPSSFQIFEDPKDDHIFPNKFNLIYTIDHGPILGDYGHSARSYENPDSIHRIIQVSGVQALRAANVQ